MGDIPLYSDLGKRELALKNSIRTYKHEALKAMRATGEFEPETYAKVKHFESLIKKPDVVPRVFPSKAEEIRYPEPALKKNFVYQTTSQNYGADLPTHADIPTKYYPRPENFAGTFNGGMYVDTGLNTIATKSKVHRALDQ